MNLSEFLRPTTVVNVNKDEYDVYIGRGTVWGNPYVIGTHGTREEVIQKYRNHIARQIKLGKVTKSMLYDLKGKRLGCHCKPLACHGDVLKYICEGI